MEYRTSPVTQAFIHREHLAHTMRVLQELLGHRPLWPVRKATAYGHGADMIGRHLVHFGSTHVCVAHVAEAIELVDAGVQATMIGLSATRPATSAYCVAYGFEPVVCTLEMVESLARAAPKVGRRIAVHLKVETGRGRLGMPPEAGTVFLDRCRAFPTVFVKGLMRHFPWAHALDTAFSHKQIEVFRQVQAASRGYGIAVYHCANSAAIFDLPEAYGEATRPGIAIDGLRPSHTLWNPRVQELKPVLEWKTRITYLKEVSAGTGLSYGPTLHTMQPSVIATMPLGYGDGLSQRCSNALELLVHGRRCRQVGQICMDQGLLDVTALRGQVNVGDEVVIIGRQGQEEVTADALAAQLGTINYEIVTNIAKRVPRIVVGLS